jgi:hypothetical protein
VKNKIIQGWFIFCNIPDDDKIVIIKDKIIYLLCHGHDCMVVGFTITYAVSVLSPLML